MAKRRLKGLFSVPDTEIAHLNNQAAANFIKPRQPFPMNPFFVPVAPIHNTTRQQIFELYTSNPVIYTPAKLASLFGISIVRATAILRLQAVASNLKESGKPLQVDYQKEMDKMLGSVVLTEGAPRRELMRERVGGPLGGYVLFLDEEMAFTPEVSFLKDIFKFFR